MVKKSFNMKNEQLYNKTVNTLVQAYFNDTLSRGSCRGCAIGNILGGVEWGSVFITSSDTGIQTFAPKGTIIGVIYLQAQCGFQPVPLESEYACYTTEANRKGWEMIENSGYTVEELMKVEFAFETGYKGDDSMFGGLMAVIDVLDEIHENKEEIITKETKAKFAKV